MKFKQEGPKDLDRSPEFWHTGIKFSTSNLLNASSFLQKASRNCHHLLLLASENKSFSYQPNYATQHKLYGKQCRSRSASF